MTKLSQTFSIISLMLLFLCKSTSTTAQSFNYMAASQRMLHSQYMDMQMQLIHKNLSRINYRNHISTDGKIAFDFMLKNSRRKLSTISSIYMDSVKRKTYILYDDFTLRDNDPKRIQRVYPTDVQSIKVSGDFNHTFQPQLTTDSCWMFRALKGEITLYSNGFVPVAMQKHDGEVQQFSKNAVLAILKEDKAAMELFDNGEYIKAIEKYNRNFKKAEDKAYDEAHRVD